jgi:hypothetical protein
MTRLWLDGSLITVVTGGLEEPSCFTWREQTHTVKAITRRWRINQDWWRERVWRDYFKLITQTGLLVIIYHDLQDDQWYLERLYD